MKTLLQNVILDGCSTSILIESGIISRIAPGITIPDAEIFDGCSQLAVLPPFYNAHNNAAMTLLRGYA